MNNRILIVDDHPAVRMAIQLVLASEGYNVVAQVDNGQEALALLEKSGPLTVILDLAIPKIDGLGVLCRIASRKLPVKIVVVSGLAPEYLSTRCRRLGAHGFVSKQAPLSELVKAVGTVRDNQEYFPTLCNHPSLATDHNNEYELLNNLSAREFTVMQHLLLGLSGNEIAFRLHLSNRTVSTYKIRIFQKLHIGTLLELYDLAERNNLR